MTCESNTIVDVQHFTGKPWKGTLLFIGKWRSSENTYDAIVTDANVTVMVFAPELLILT